MPRMFRSMLRDGDRPMVGPSAKMLGVRVPPAEKCDLSPDENGEVAPGTGGMSVAPNWRDLPDYRIPERLQHILPGARGKDNLSCWRMGNGPFEPGFVADQLVLRPGATDHGMVEPDRRMLLASYILAIEATRDLWVIDED